MSSVRQQIVDALETRLSLITVGKVWTLTSGVTHTCTTAISGVYPWRKLPFTPAQLPAIAFWDSDSTLGDGALSLFTHKLDIDIIGYLTATAPIDGARALSADIIAAIGSDPRWGGLARYSEITANSLDQQDGGDVVAAAQLKLTIDYTTGLWQL